MGRGREGDCMECKLARERFWQNISRWVRDGKKGGEEIYEKKEEKNETEWKKIKKKKQAETDKICLREINMELGSKKKKQKFIKFNHNKRTEKTQVGKVQKNRKIRKQQSIEKS